MHSWLAIFVNNEVKHEYHCDTKLLMKVCGLRLNGEEGKNEERNSRPIAQSRLNRSGRGGGAFKTSLSCHHRATPSPKCRHAAHTIPARYFAHRPSASPPTVLKLPRAPVSSPARRRSSPLPSILSLIPPAASPKHGTQKPRPGEIHDGHARQILVQAHGLARRPAHRAEHLGPLCLADAPARQAARLVPGLPGCRRRPAIRVLHSSRQFCEYHLSLPHQADPPPP